MSSNSENPPWHSACGKVILFGEHAVVYGVTAIAGGIPNVMRARVLSSENATTTIAIPKWGVDLTIGNGTSNGQLLENVLLYLTRALHIQNENFHLELDPGIPHASGLGASAAVAVCTIRALAAKFRHELSEAEINQLAFGCEEMAHGSPSGLDNTLATYGGLLSYRKTADGPQRLPVECPNPIPLVIALSGKKGYTAATVKRVAEYRAAEPQKYQKIFQGIAQLSVQALSAIANSDFETLAGLMNRNQILLREMGVSCSEIEQVIDVALSAGAQGAKLTGSGDGGAVIIYAAQHTDSVISALKQAGFESFTAQLGKL
ncbi:mevalonate kinase [Alteromonadaceae bacterium 2753L.S.0a.02]|nr:mevalonate kinase [Alteromonadaceae bacterium 2753L.S.0a.02]